jgi:DNA polymerase (family 10)
MAFALEILEGPTPRARTYGTAARTVFQLDGDLAELRASGALARVRGLGPSCLAVIDDVLAGQEPAELTELEAQIPEGLFEIRSIRGLGPAKIRALHEGLGISTLAELEQACKENRLVTLPGFGDKTQAKILEGAQELRRREGKLLRDSALAIGEHVLAGVSQAEGVTRAIFVGGLATGEEIIESIEILALGPADAIDAAVERAGAADGRVREAKVHVHRADAATFGLEEVKRTSDEAHLSALFERAKTRGVALDTAPFASAEDLYEALDLAFVPAEGRNAETPLLARGRPTKTLIARGDLRGALHNHTLASDGTGTLREMRDAAAKAGLSYLGISEHSQSADYARGLSPGQLDAQRREIAALNAEGGCALLSGVESDILPDGALDYPNEVLAPLEVVIASSHRRFSLDRAKSTARMVAAAANPRTDVIGHPTGRLLLGRAPLDMDMEAFLDACAASGCAVELNGSAHRLDLGARELAMAKERGVPISIAADAHATDEIEEHLTHGIAIARRAGLGPEDVLNARTLESLRAWLAARRTRQVAK